MRRYFLTLFIFLAAAFMLPMGCGPFWVNPYITVNDSPLNWVEIHYYNMNRKPYRRIAVRLTGMGFVEIKKGTSDLVSNDFAKRSEDPEWDNYKTQKLQVDPEHIRQIFQNLVNYGLLDRDKEDKKRSKKETFDRFLAVKANISNVTYSERDNIYEVDPELAEELYDVIREFDNPSLR